MSREIVKVTLLGQDDADILRFHIDENELDINLNSVECQKDLKNLFTIILEKAVKTKIEMKLEIQDEYSRGMYIEVCKEYIKDLNRELEEVTEIIKKELNDD